MKRRQKEMSLIRSNGTIAAKWDLPKRIKPYTIRGWYAILRQADQMRATLQDADRALDLRIRLDTWIYHV